MKNNYYGLKQFTHKDTNKVLSIAECFECHDKLIMLIKLTRTYTLWDLKTAKYYVERFKIPGTSNPSHVNIDQYLNELYDYAKEKRVVNITREQLFDILSTALDNSDALYFNDPLDVIITTAQNIKTRGGLTQIAEEMDSFIRSI